MSCGAGALFRLAPEFVMRGLKVDLGACVICGFLLSGYGRCIGRMCQSAENACNSIRDVVCGRIQ